MNADTDNRIQTIAAILASTLIALIVVIDILGTLVQR